MRQSTSEILKFMIMGSLAALVHGVILYLAVSLFNIYPAWANVVAFLCAFIASFFGHSWVTFHHNIQRTNKGDNIKRLARWFGSSILGFALNQGLFMLGLGLYGERYYLLIWFVVTAIITVLSFLLGKLWAFKS